MATGTLLVAHFGQVTDIYTATDIGVGGTTIAQKTFGLSAGQLLVENHKLYRFVKAGQAISNNQAVTIDTTGSQDDANQVMPTNAVGQALVGVCENGQGIPQNEYGWIVIKGKASCKCLTATSQYAVLASTTTAGVLGTPANTDVTIQRATACDAGIASNGAINVLLM